LAVDVTRQLLYVAELGNDTVGVVDLEHHTVLRTLARQPPFDGSMTVASANRVSLLTYKSMVYDVNVGLQPHHFTEKEQVTSHRSQETQIPPPIDQNFPLFDQSDLLGLAFLGRKQTTDHL
jgi:hypothetical protein